MITAMISDHALKEDTASTLRLRGGLVVGRSNAAVIEYRDIPYAAAPARDARFDAPGQVPRWNGVFTASVPGANSPQRVRSVPALDVAPLIGTGWVEDDTYLTLDVVRPADKTEGLPVMVWIHGGGFVVGSKDAGVQDGTTFARDGIVYVAINYRLGIEGFLPIPGVPTNLGLRDIIAALEWVQSEISAFGGDPSNVTVFGESAGAMAIADLVTSPLAKGLFRRAIIQSGHGGMTRDVGIAQRLVKKLARLLKITPDRAGFSNVSQSDALDALEKVSLPTTRLDLRDADGREPVFGISRFVPVHGDDVLPMKPLDALKTGAGRDVDVLIGSNAEEMNLYLVTSGVREKIGRLLSIFVLHRSHPRARATLKAYGLGKRKAGHVLTDAMSDLVFRWPARRFAEEHQGRTHMYEFDWRSPRFDGTLGAAHGMELGFVFDSLAAVTGPEGLCGEAPPQALADRVHRIWVDFARDGTLPWDPFERDTRQVYRLAKGVAAHEPPMPCAPFLP